MKKPKIEEINGTYYLILTSKKYGVHHCPIDFEDVEKISSRTWFIVKRPRTMYVYSSLGSLHGMLLNVSRGSGERPDHIDGDGLNNRKENLRLSNASQNGRNRKSGIGRKYKGVIVIKPCIKSRIFVDGKFIYLGIFNTEKDAAIAYNKAALTYFGEFARLNVIPE